jgi:CHASE2 domain-containing sensor protein/GGDEF domain-containing protein
VLDRLRLIAAFRAIVLPLLVITTLFAFGLMESLSLKVLDLYGQMFATRRPAEQMLIVAYDRFDVRRFGGKVVQSDGMTQSVLTRVLAGKPKAVGLTRVANFDAPDSAGLIALVKANPNVLLMDRREVTALKVAAEAPPAEELRTQSATQIIQTDVDRIVRRQVLAWPLLDPETEKPTGANENGFCFTLAQLALGPHSPLSLDANNVLLVNGKAQAALTSGSGDYAQSLGMPATLILPKHASDMDLVTYQELLAPEFDLQRLAGKVILLGSVVDSSQAFQLSFQSLKTAYDTSFFVDIMAHQVSNLLDVADGHWPVMRAPSAFVGYLWGLAWLVLCAWILVPTARPLQWLSIGAGTLGALIGITLLAFYLGWWLPVFAPATGIVLVTIAAISNVFRTESSLKAFADVTQRALNRLPEPVFVKDSLGRIRMVNESFCRLAGMLPKTIIGEALTKVLPYWRTEALLSYPGDYNTGNRHPNEPTDAELNSTPPELFTDAFGRKFELNLITSRLPRAGRQDLVFGLVRTFHAIGDEHDLPANTEALEKRFEQLAFWASKHGLNALVQLISIEDFELLQEAYLPEQVEKLLKHVHERLRRAFSGADALERATQAGHFWLMRKLEFSEDTASQTRHALDLAFNWPFEIAGEKVELTALCAGASAPIDAEDFAGLARHIKAQLCSDIPSSANGDAQAVAR